MLSFEASTWISASAGRVWDTLVQTDRWPQWDPALEQVDGTLTRQGRITIHVRDVRRPFRLRVATWHPGRSVVLTGGMPLGLFTGTRTYHLEPARDRTHVTMTEHYTGPLGALIGRSIPDLQPSFDAFVAGLRTAAEQ